MDNELWRLAHYVERCLWNVSYLRNRRCEGKEIGKMIGSGTSSGIDFVERAYFAMQQ